MIVCITRNRVKERDAYLKLAVAFAEDIKTIKGNVMSRVVVPQDSDDEVVFISEWESKEAWQAHVGGDVFNKHIPAMGPYYVSGTDNFFDIAL